MNERRSLLTVLLNTVVVLLFTLSGSDHGGQLTSQFYNILLQDGADPWMCKHTDGYYYPTCTNQKNDTVWRSRSLSGIGAREKKIVWSPSPNGPYSKNVWALGFIGLIIVGTSMWLPATDRLKANGSLFSRTGMTIHFKANSSSRANCKAPFPNCEQSMARSSS